MTVDTSTKSNFILNYLTKTCALPLKMGSRIAFINLLIMNHWIIFSARNHEAFNIKTLNNWLNYGKHKYKHTQKKNI